MRAWARTRARAPVLVPVAVPVVRRAPSSASPRGGGGGGCGGAEEPPPDRRGRRRRRPRPRTGAAAPSPPLAPRAAARRRPTVGHAPPARPRRRSAASRACCSRPRRGPPGRAPASVVTYLLNPRGDSKSPRPRRSPRQLGRSADGPRGRGPAAAACAPPRRRGAAFVDSRWSRRRPPRRPPREARLHSRARSKSFVASQGRSMAKLAARPTSAAGSFGAASTLRLRNHRPQASRAACDAGAEGFMLFRGDSCSFEAYGVLWQALWQRGAMCSPPAGYSKIFRFAQRLDCDQCVSECISRVRDLLA